jgi:hypothetical protein
MPSFLSLLFFTFILFNLPPVPLRAVVATTIVVPFSDRAIPAPAIRTFDAAHHAVVRRRTVMVAYC